MLTFGQLLKNLRLEANIGQRELARNIGVSSTYLNDIENDKRPAPKKEILDSIHEFLNIENDKFFDLAGLSKKSLPPDVEEYLLNEDTAINLVRFLKNSEVTKTQIREIQKFLVSKNYRAIIIAAGLGSRLKNFTKNTPKCMLEVNGKPIIEHQIDAYKSNGVETISVVRGYQKEKINIPGLNYYENTDFKNNNVLNSLFFAEKEIYGNVIISYSDIIFTSSVIERLLDSTADISIVVDVDWRQRYIGREDHPISEAENVIFDANQQVVDIGKILTKPSDVFGEFIGLMKLSPRGAEIIKRHFHRAKTIYWNKAYQKAKSFQNAYITDFLKDMIDLGVPVHTVIIERGWQEIDTVEDLENASKIMRQNRIVKNESNK